MQYLGARRLLTPVSSRALLQAYNAQQFDAETIGLKYSEGDRRRLLGADAPAGSTYRTVTLGVTLGPSLSLVRSHPWPCIEHHRKYAIAKSLTWDTREPPRGSAAIKLKGSVPSSN